MLRINKYLARCGVTSRRVADVFVAEGRVTVNGRVVDTPGLIIDESSDKICLDGRPVKPDETYTYIVLNKPAGYISSHSDPHHNKTIIDLLEDLPARVNPVGRLDLDTEGVLLLTNDGELAFRLTHPRYQIKKVYVATVKGVVDQEKLQRLQNGIRLPDGKVGRAKVAIEEQGSESTILRLELTEGRKREVKHICKVIGHPVIYLYRKMFAGIGCQDLKKGTWRHLDKKEVDALYTLAGLSADQAKPQI